MKVLVACEESQAVCIAFRARGHDAFSCDIQEPSGGHPEWHILGDALIPLRGGIVTTMDGKEHDVGTWDLLIAHPPCTYLSNAGARHLGKAMNYSPTGSCLEFKVGTCLCGFGGLAYHLYALRTLFHQKYSACRRARRSFSRINSAILTQRKHACG